MADEIESSVERALRRLDAKPDWELRCWQCGHTDKTPDDPARQSYRCEKCGAVTAYGHPQPRIRIVPHQDRRFVVSLVETIIGGEKKVDAFVLERGYAAEYAWELLSVTDPVKWRAVQALAAVTREVAGEVANGELVRTG